MTTQDTQESAATDVTDQVAEPVEDKTPAGARAKIERQDAKLAEYDEKFKAIAFKQLGVEAGSGPANALERAYDGDWSDVDAVVKYAASEFEGVFQVASPSEEKRVESLAEHEARVDGMRTASQPLENDSYERDLAALRDEGDVEGSILLQAQHFYG